MECFGGDGRERTEAGSFLLGLMRIHGGDPARMSVLIRAVSCLESGAAADALKDEFHRVPSSPATRTYLNEVLLAIARLPAPLARKALNALGAGRRLSPKWRRRFEEAAWRINH